MAGHQRLNAQAAAQQAPGAVEGWGGAVRQKQGHEVGWDSDCRSLTPGS